MGSYTLCSTLEDEWAQDRPNIGINQSRPNTSDFDAPPLALENKTHHTTGKHGGAAKSPQNHGMEERMTDAVRRTNRPRPSPRR